MVRWYAPGEVEGHPAEAIKFVNFRESRIIAFNLDRTKQHYQSRRRTVTGNSPDDEISDYSLVDFAS